MSQSRFSNVAAANIQRSKFNRSHNHKTTFDANYLIPVFVDEVLPGDTVKMSSTTFARLATPIKPSMDNLHMDVHFFFVPNRLVWDNWEKFMGQQDNPGDSTDFLIPQRTPSVGGFPEDNLFDYFQLPTKIPNTEGITALPIRAYNLIWNEWFRDQNMQDSVAISKGDGPDDTAATQASLLRRGKRHDYFTSCLPFPQKGPTVDLPLGGTAPVTGTGFPTFSADSGAITDRSLFGQFTSNGDNNVLVSPGIDPDSSHTLLWDDPALIADLGDATAASINQLRQAITVQQYFELDARGGTRYTEKVLNHFGVHSPDARLQRPEFLGGGSTPINITPIATTSDIASVGGQGTVGDLGAMGTASFRNHGFTKSFTEHGHVIGLINVRADLTYQQGVNKMWSRKHVLDFYWPVFANLGEQAVLNREIYLQDQTINDPDTGNPVNDEPFGYQERYAEYRYKPSWITGAFRSNHTASLDPWHLSQDFADLPTLSSEFIEDNPPLDRVVAVPSEPKFIADFYFNLICARCMPSYSIPGLTRF